MEINTQFYTTAQEDITGRYGMKRFTKTFKDMIIDGDLPCNETWDMSISPFAINPNKHPDASYASDIINKCWIFPDMNNLTGIDASTPESPDMVLKFPLYKRQLYYPFAMYSGSGSGTNGLAYPYWLGRNGYNQTAGGGDFPVYKWSLYGVTKYAYNRLVWLIRVYVSAYGHNNASLKTSNFYKGSWYSLSDIDDTMWTAILSGSKDITGVRFVPYYANGETLTSRIRSDTTGLYSMAEKEPLNGSATGLGLAPYTEDYIDYALSTYAAIGTDDSEGARGGNPTLALGCIGENDNNTFALKHRTGDWHWDFYDSLAEWASDGNFIQENAYQKNGTDSEFWVNKPKQYNSYQYLYFRQHLNTEILTTKELCREYLITQCAYLGGYFTDKTATATGGALNDADMYLGIIESDGMTAGRYQRGLDIIIPDIDNPWTDVGWTPPAPEGAFKDATNLVKVRIPQSCSTIGRYAFEDTQLTKVTIASDCTYYNTSFPNGCVVNFYPD